LDTEKLKMERFKELFREEGADYFEAHYLATTIKDFRVVDRGPRDGMKSKKYPRKQRVYIISGVEYLSLKEAAAALTERDGA
jgi:hypothetical protein